MLTRNIAKSGEVLNWGGFSPFGLHLGLIVNRSQSASCHIATVIGHPKCGTARPTRMTLNRQILVDKDYSYF